MLQWIAPSPVFVPIFFVLKHTDERTCRFVKEIRPDGRYDIIVLDKPRCLVPDRPMGPEETNLLNNRKVWLAERYLPFDDDGVRQWAEFWTNGFFGWIDHGIHFELPRDADGDRY